MDKYEEGVIYEIQYKLSNGKEAVWILYNKKSQFFYQEEAEKRFKEITDIWVHLSGDLRLVKRHFQDELLLDNSVFEGRYTGTIIPTLYFNVKD